MARHRSRKTEIELFLPHLPTRGLGERCWYDAVSPWLPLAMVLTLFLALGLRLSI
ncbi:MAG: hypothetical protein HYU66_14210 [Armatimonadetes bacterium]|nr:hypothetical protein [Armatimonadota bacterium]